MFHTFKSQDERREFGGSAFIEVQFCKLPKHSDVKRLVAVKSIDQWQNDSLYINDACLFYQEYSSVFNCGIYNNLKIGTMDLFGINYYAPSSIDSLIKRIDEKTPLDYDTLKDWLSKAKEYNGFYILGM